MKTQMRFQNIIIKVTLILAALAALYGLSFCTGAIAYIAHVTPSYNVTVDNGEAIMIFGDLLESEGGWTDLCATYDLAQSYTNILLWLGVAFILLVVVVYIFAGSKRRNYYAINYITIGLVAVFAVVYAVIAVILSAQIQSQVLSNEAWINFEEYIEQQAQYGDYSYKYSRSVWIYDVGYVLSGILVIDAGALIFNLIWKFKLMRGEKQLLANGHNMTEVKEVA